MKQKNSQCYNALIPSSYEWEGIVSKLELWKRFGFNWENNIYSSMEKEKLNSFEISESNGFK